MDPISSIANAVGSIANIFSSGQQASAMKAQAAAQKYLAGQMTEQQYLAYQQAQEQGLTGLASQVYATKNETNYLPLVAVAGLFIVLAILIFNKSKA